MIRKNHIVCIEPSNHNIPMKAIRVILGKQVSKEVNAILAMCVEMKAAYRGLK
jgi:hypothetical protein